MVFRGSRRSRRPVHCMGQHKMTVADTMPHCESQLSFHSINGLSTDQLSSSGAVGSLPRAVSSTSSVVAARPTPIHLEPLSATVVALIRFISHLNIKICKLLSLKLQKKQIRVVFAHLKLGVKVVRHNSKCVKI